MSPDRNLPRWARIAGRVLRAAVYALGALAGAGDIWHTSPVMVQAVGLPWILVWGWLAVAAGVTGAAAVAVWRWRWELVAVCALGTALGARAVAVWAAWADGQDTLLSPAAVMTAAALYCVLRGLDLTTFAIRTSAATLARRRRERP